MGIKEDVIAAATDILQQTPQGLTKEALVRQIAPHLTQRLLSTYVIDILRKQPQTFVEGGDGRWRLREQANLFMAEDMTVPMESTSATPVQPSSLRQGSYVVFDLETTGQDARSPATEIIQIAAHRWVDGVSHAPWASFVLPTVPIPAKIQELTHITMDMVHDAPSAAEALRRFFDYSGDLPLIAHNGASYDGPLIAATCERLGLSLPTTFLVLDTLPLARVLLPSEKEHKVGTLARKFGCDLPDAHRADADVEMLDGIVQGLERVIDQEPTGAAVYELLRRAADHWTMILKPPRHIPLAADIIATFGSNLTELLPERTMSHATAIDVTDIDSTFKRAEALGRSRREAQLEMAHQVADTLRNGGYAITEAGTGTGKSQGYAIPAALQALATGKPVALSTYTRILQTQLVERELPFVQQLIPDLTYAQLQGRANYLSLSRLAEEVEDAWAEAHLPSARAWTLAMLVRFAESSVRGNLEELGYAPQSLEEYLSANGAVLQTLSSVRASRDDHYATFAGADFYQRARENAEHASLVIVNHALLLNSFLRIAADEEPFVSQVVCDEAHTLEDAATKALEQRVEERVLQRILQAIHHPGGRGGLVHDARLRLGLAANDPLPFVIAQAVDTALAALDGLASQLYRYVTHKTVVGKAELERYGVRVSIDGGALAAAGGPALKSTADTLGQALRTLRSTLDQLVEQASTALQQHQGQPSGRLWRVMRLAHSLQRDLREISEQYGWF